uniref:Reverse transcriptase domain-containing protein n=1 Tax=Tanacetum cinerariifolium TaxID=118510 RepID=A0A6L2MF98_TANCI|nr:reverse transcriptase domain-containing protein [Tanacetum cinerariifolium]
MELNLEARLMGETLVLNRSLDLFFQNYIELDDLNVLLKLMRNQVDDLMPTIKEGEVVEEFRAINDTRIVSKFFGYPNDCDHDKKIRIDNAYNLKFSCMIDDMDAYRDDGMSDVIFGEPFLREVRNNAKRFEGMITIHGDDESVTYQMARSIPREGIVLGHKISKSGIDVDRVKVDVIAKLPHLTTIKGVRSFLGHADYVGLSAAFIKLIAGLDKMVLDEAHVSVTEGFLFWRSSELLSIAVDYLSKWVEAKALLTNDARVVVKFLKSLFSRFGIPRAIISDRGTYFCNDQFTRVMIKYGVTHQLATAYHPQSSGQVEVNGHPVKHYFRGDIPFNVALDLHTFPWTTKLGDRVKLSDSVIKNKALRGRHPMLIYFFLLSIF